MNFSAVWQALFSATTGAIIAVLYQYFGIGHGSLLFIGTGLLGLITLLALKHLPLKLRLFGIFFGLASIALNLHWLQRQYKLEYLQQKTWLVAGVSHIQPDPNGYSNTLTLECNQIGLFGCKITALKTIIPTKVGEQLTLNPQRMAFFTPKTQNIWLLRDKNLAMALPQKWAIKKNYQPIHLRQKLLIYKDNFVQKIAALMPATINELFVSIFFGKKTLNCDNAAKELFCIWGLSHFLARSGLHVAIFLGIIWWLFSWIPILGVVIRSIISLLLLACYSALSWASISFTRASSLFALVLIAKIFGLKSQGYYLLALIALFIILSNPFELLCVDFQLSFALTFALMLGSKILHPNTSLKKQKQCKYQ